MTKKEKREKKKNDRGIVDFIMIYKHLTKKTVLLHSGLCQGIPA